jgi:hypothetical protein
MKCLLLTSVTLVLLISCSSREKITFESIAKKIKTIDLPFSSECGKDLKIIELVGEDTAIYKYIPNTPDSSKLSIIGKIIDNNKFIALLLADTYPDVQLHYIATFTRKGELITKFELYRVGGLEDENYFGEAECTISKDITINLKDSTAEYKRDSSGNIINESIVSKFHNDFFMIADDGTIVKK